MRNMTENRGQADDKTELSAAKLYSTEEKEIEFFKSDGSQQKNIGVSKQGQSRIETIDADALQEDDRDLTKAVQDPRNIIEDSERKEREYKMMSDYKDLLLPKHPRSTIKSELLVKDVKKFIEDMKKKTDPKDLEVRIIPSNMACRFELPLDLTRLKGECPLSYLKKYCRVTDSRHVIYKEKFENFKSELKTIKILNLQKIYENLYHESVLQDEILHLQRLLVIDLSLELDVETFIFISCLMERIVLKSHREGSSSSYKKNVFEGANFSALNGKLQHIDISPQIMTLLQYIRGT